MSKMWDITPFEYDPYVSAEDDALAVEKAKIEADMEGEDPSQGVCYICNKVDSLCRCADRPLREVNPMVRQLEDECETRYDGQPSFEQEYESPEDVYTEQDADSDD